MQRLRIIAALIAAVLLICSSRSVYATGYEITEHSTKAMGMASAVAARADDPSAVYYNTAGLSQIKRPEATLGVTFVTFDMKTINRSGREEDITQSFYVPNFFFSTPVVNNDLVFGLGVYAPYGLGTEWDEDGITRYSVVRAAMQTTYITPALSWQVNPKLSLGAGISFIDSRVELTSRYPFSIILPGLSPDADVRLTGRDQTWGWTAGILAKPFEDLSLGFSYRSKSVLKYKGNMDITDISPVAQSVGASSKSSYQSNISAELPLPERYSLGIGYKLLPGWMVEFDYERIRWSVFNSLDIDMEDENTFFFDTKSERDWHDTNAFKLGTEVQVSQNWALRMGGFYFNSPVPDRTLHPGIPDADRYGFALGAGYHWGNFRVDAGYMSVYSKPRIVDNDELEANSAIVKAAGLTPGEDRYEARIHQAGLNLSYAF